MVRQSIVPNADPISYDDLNDLARSVGPVVSLFVPTHRAGPETNNDAAQLRPLVEKAEADLAQRFPDADAAALLDPIRSLAAQDRFWQEQVDGLAIFSGSGFLHYFRTDTRFEPYASVGDHPDIRPLVPLVANDADFAILAISRNRVRFLRACRTAITELPLGTIPASADDVEGYSTREPQPQNQEDTVTAGFLQVVGKAVNNRLSTKRLPLVIASVAEYYGPLTAELTNVRVLGKPVAGNPDNLSPAQLHAAAWPQVADDSAARHRANQERFAQALGTGLASGDPASIILAADSGRVETMLLTEQGLTSPNSADDLNHAIARTLQTGGTLDVVEKLESEHKSGAVYRY